MLFVWNGDLRNVLVEVFLKEGSYYVRFISFVKVRGGNFDENIIISEFIRFSCSSLFCYVFFWIFENCEGWYSEIWKFFFGWYISDDKVEWGIDLR